MLLPGLLWKMLLRLVKFSNVAVAWKRLSLPAQFHARAAAANCFWFPPHPPCTAV